MLVSPAAEIERFAREASRGRAAAERLARAALVQAGHVRERARQEHLLEAADHLSDCAMYDLATAMTGHPSGIPDAMLSLSSLTFAINMLSVVEGPAFDAIYILAVQYLLGTPTGLERTVSRLRAMRWDTPESDSADVLALIPRKLWPLRCNAVPHAIVVEAVRLLHSDRNADIRRVAQRMVTSFEKRGAAPGEMPFSWIPLPLLLMRAECQQDGVAWIEPQGAAWEMWRSFRIDRRRRQAPPAIRDLLMMVRGLEPFLVRARQSESTSSGAERGEVTHAIKAVRAVERAVVALAGSNELAATLRRARSSGHR